MKHLIIGTAGHVDHGKTSLVKALTNVDTDRLKEEKERGITIELGFAPLTLRSGDTVSIVDVPGHERFVRNMVAGAGGIDLVLLVIAADEGIMPQTREHMEICDLLGIRHGIVALTKIDLVDPDWLNLIREDIKDYLDSTFLGNAPILPVSVVTGEGIADLLAALETAAQRIETRSSSGFFRLPADRVFSMKGFGTVVTGSLVSGSVAVGDAVEILPGQTASKVRGIQIHGHKVESATAGDRTAVNLQGIERLSIERGAVVCHPGIFTPTSRIDVRLTYLKGNRKKLKHRALVRFHTGTCELIARILLLERDDLDPGQTAFAQIVLEHAAIAMAHDRFVIRSYSPVTTIGGGEVVDPHGVKHRGRDAAVIASLEKLFRGTELERIETIAVQAGMEGITETLISVRTGVPRATTQPLLDRLCTEKKIVALDGEEPRFVSRTSYDTLQDRIIRTALRYHQENPLREWIPKEELRITLGSYIDGKLFASALRDLQERKQLTVEREGLMVAGHRVTLKDDLARLKESVRLTYEESGLTPPLTKEVYERFPRDRENTRKALALLIQEGYLVKVSEDLLFTTDILAALKGNYRTLLAERGNVSPAMFREMTGLSRKFTIPLMEYFDKIRFTIRVGDYRRARKEIDGE